MAATITVTEEAQAFFTYKPDSALQQLIGGAAQEYSAFMGGLPIEVDAFQEEDSPCVRVYISVLADAARGSLREKHHEFMREWRSRHTREELRAVGFSYRYL